jgi:hypothetical protein
MILKIIASFFTLFMGFTFCAFVYYLHDGQMGYAIIYLILTMVNAHSVSRMWFS